MSLKAKICAHKKTRRRCVIKAGADAIGFIFSIEPEESGYRYCKGIGTRYSPFVSVVAVVSDPSSELMTKSSIARFLMQSSFTVTKAWT